MPAEPFLLPLRSRTPPVCRRRWREGREERPWPRVSARAGDKALCRLSHRRRRARCFRALKARLSQQEWTWFWTQTFRPEFGVSSGATILTWWIPLLESYMNGRLKALFCATEPHRRNGLWHAHMLVKERSSSARAEVLRYQARKEWAYNLVGIARVYPFDARRGVEYALKYMLKGRNPWKWREYACCKAD